MDQVKRKLKLFLVGNGKSQLDSTEFDCLQSNTHIRCVRGKVSGPLAPDERSDLSHSWKFSSFQWTAAVRAMTVLLIRHAASALSNTSKTQSLNSALIQGGRGSAALSLDYSITKKCTWIIDMFGFTPASYPIALCLFKRRNSALKSEGPVVISIDENVLPAQAIEVYFNNQPVLEAETLLQIATAVDSSCLSENDCTHKSKAPANKILDITDKLPLRTLADCNALQQFIQAQVLSGPLNFPFDQPENRKFLKKAMTQQIVQGLSANSIFSLSEEAALLRRVAGNRWMRRLVTSPASYFCPLSEELSSAERLGFAHETLEFEKVMRDGPCINVRSSASGISTFALVRYLQYVKGYNIKVDYFASNTIELAQAITRGRTNPEQDVFAVSICNATIVLKENIRKTGYIPLMPTPSVSFRLMGKKKLPQNGFANRAIRIYTNTFERASTMLHYQDLREQGFFASAKVKSIHMESDELARIVRAEDADSCFILWFPYTDLNAYFNSLNYLDASASVPTSREGLLFAPSSFFGKSKRALYLNIAIRNAWLTLKENPSLLDMIVDSMVEDRAYIKYLTRVAGLYDLDMSRQNIGPNAQARQMKAHAQQLSVADIPARNVK